MIFAVADLLLCVGTLTAYEEMDRSGDYSDNQIEKALDEAKRVEPELYTKWAAVNGAMNRFNNVTDTEVDRLRRRIRQIDDSVVEGHI